MIACRSARTARCRDDDTRVLSQAELTQCTASEVHALLRVIASKLRDQGLRKGRKHERPYTEEQEAEMYRRMNAGRLSLSKPPPYAASAEQRKRVFSREPAPRNAPT